MKTTQLKSNLWLTIVLLIVNLGLFNTLFRGVSALRIDMTQGKVYSLSNATKTILENLDEEVRIKAYFSKIESIDERIRPFVPEIRDLLKEYATVGSGLVRVDFIDPEADEAEQKKAETDYGLQPNAYAYSDQTQQGVRSYWFGIVVEYATSRPVTITIEELIKSSISIYDKEPRVETKNVEFAVTRAIKKTRTGFEGAKDIFARFDKKAKISTYISDVAELPEVFKKVPESAKKVFAQLAADSGGKLTYENVPVPTKEEELMAFVKKTGVRPIQFPTSDKPFFLWSTLEFDGKLAYDVPLLTQEGGLGEHELRERFEGIFKREAKGLLRKIGIVQETPDFNPMMAQMGQRPPAAPYDALSATLEEDFEVQSLNPTSFIDVPGDIDVLLVMNPRNLTDKAAYAIDQYVMRGGRAILCVDGTDTPKLEQLTPMTVAEGKSGLEDMLATWGVTISKDVVMAKEAGMFFWSKSQNLSRQRDFTSFTWPALPLVGGHADEVNAEAAPFLDGAEPVRFWFASSITTKDVPGIKTSWLLRTGESAWKDGPGSLTPDLAHYPEYGYPDTGHREVGRHTLAVLLQGKFKSSFAEKPIPVAAPDPGKPAESQPTSRPIATATLKESADNRLVIFANDDFLDNVQAGIARSLGRPYGYFTPNATAIKNTIDWLLEDDALVTIRNRGRAFRPLEKVEPKKASLVQWMNFTIPLLLIAGISTAVFMARAGKKPVI